MKAMPVRGGGRRGRGVKRGRKTYWTPLVLGKHSFVEAIMEAVHTPLLVLDANLTVRAANHAFYDLFQVSPEATKGRFIGGAGNGGWNFPRLRQALQGGLTHQGRLPAFEGGREVPRNGAKDILSNGDG